MGVVVYDLIAASGIAVVLPACWCMVYFLAHGDERDLFKQNTNVS